MWLVVWFNGVMKNIIEVSGLTKQYGDVKVVDGISFAVKKGEIFGILGPNGAGKTTTLEMLETLRPIDSGEVVIDGIDVRKHPEQIEKIIGVQLQSSAFLKKLTLKDQLNLFAGIYNEEVNFEKMLADFGLQDKQKDFVESLSGGQKQRFSIATALVNKPKVLFLDEPTTGLDPQARRNLWELIRDIKKRGITIILTTHYMDEAELLCDRLAIMMLSQSRCHAVCLLRSKLKDWELYQIKVRVEREINEKKPLFTDPPREEFYKELSQSLAELASGPGPQGKASSGHLLIHILENSHVCIAGRILKMYNIRIEEMTYGLSQLPDEEMYVSEIRIIRRREVSPEKDEWQPMIDERSFRNVNQNGGQDEDLIDGHNNENKKSMLSKYGVELTRAAAQGKIDPVIGRGREIERLVQILGRRKKNNPVLVGEAGVGKSAIVEGLALKIASGDAPSSLKNKKLFSLDMALLVAGTKFRGEFEERIKSVIDELMQQKDTIVFIDEIHTIVGTGSTNGSLDTANILKPALARGDLQCIGATTFDEYRESIENDSALERRFQKIIVEPTGLGRGKTAGSFKAKHHFIPIRCRYIGAACIYLVGDARRGGEHYRYK